MIKISSFIFTILIITITNIQSMNVYPFYYKHINCEPNTSNPIKVTSLDRTRNIELISETDFQAIFSLDNERFHIVTTNGDLAIDWFSNKIGLYQYPRPHEKNQLNITLKYFDYCFKGVLISNMKILRSKNVIEPYPGIKNVLIEEYQKSALGLLQGYLKYIQDSNWDFIDNETVENGYTTQIIDEKKMPELKKYSKRPSLNNSVNGACKKRKFS